VVRFRFRSLFEECWDCGLPGGGSMWGLEESQDQVGTVERPWGFSASWLGYDHAEEHFSASWGLESCGTAQILLRTLGDIRALERQTDMPRTLVDPTALLCIL
jgi:hypothetical protein